MLHQLAIVHVVDVLQKLHLFFNIPIFIIITQLTVENKLHAPTIFFFTGLIFFENNYMTYHKKKLHNFTVTKKITRLDDCSHKLHFSLLGAVATAKRKQH